VYATPAIDYFLSSISSNTTIVHAIPVAKGQKTRHRNVTISSEIHPLLVIAKGGQKKLRNNLNASIT